MRRIASLIDRPYEWLAARQEYAAWFFAVSGGRSPWCDEPGCEKAALANGKCRGHDSGSRRRANGAPVRRPPRQNDACGHMERPHHAAGKCRACYQPKHRALPPRQLQETG